ncbi:hypothetical protein [Heyndrickxia coagulans]|uniref:Uncharacterized protein n=1 Tax=Heyndrickxia coagulans TaxID=1398 RepID=A0A150KHC1_HEYCO|nr:hypothetical protein [Heyndrickxia coagulans]KYC72286.1 hypothetical protein B4099_3648 [Heyndrickxia coagulans]
MEIQAQEFYPQIIADLKEQIATLADQKATQTALVTLQQREIKKLEEQLKEVLEKKEATEKELAAEKANHAGPVHTKGGNE